VPDGTTARTLAPSKEAFDTPLSPPPLGDEPGPATGRSGIYPDGTCTRRSGPVFRTQHDDRLMGRSRTSVSLQPLEGSGNRAPTGYRVR